MMDRDQALALLKTCRHIGLNAWTGHVRTASGERHVVCCRPAPGGRRPAQMTGLLHAAARALLALGAVAFGLACGAALGSARWLARQPGGWGGTGDGDAVTHVLDVLDPERALRNLEASQPANRLAWAIEAEEYARAIYEGYRDGPQYEHRPNLQLYYQQWQEAREKRDRIERELAEPETGAIGEGRGLRPREQGGPAPGLQPGHPGDRG